jgi:MoxR-like ATPase
MTISNQLLVNNFKNISDYLNQLFVGRQAEIEGLIVGVLAKQHCFLLGAPGTGKSRLISVFSDTVNAPSFTWQLSKFSTPEELFGPFSMSGLRNDKLERVQTGKLQEASIVYLDEVWKANSSILNALLSVLNERIVYDGGKPRSIPLVSCAMSSNELPEKGVGLEALYDRIALRFLVSELDQDQLVKVLSNPVPKTGKSFINLKEVEAAQVEVEKVVVPHTVLLQLAKIRTLLNQKGIIVGVRRIVDAIGILKAVAWLEGDSEVSDDHLGILSNMLWSEPKERATVVDVLASVASPTKMLVQECLDAMEEALRLIPDRSQAINAASYLAEVAKAMDALKDIRTRLSSLGNHKPSVKLGLEKAEGYIQNLTAKVMASF